MPAATSVAAPAAAPTPTDDVPDGAYYGYLKEVDLPRVSYDQVEWFTGAAATTACQQDGVSIGDSPYCHDYYIRNKNPLLRRLAFRPDATASLAGSDGSHPVPIRLSALATMVQKDNRTKLFRLTVRSGLIASVQEVFLP